MSTNQVYRSVTIVFKREQLLYDVAHPSWVEGDVLQTDNVHAVHQIQDVIQDQNVDRVTRMLDLAFAECTEMLYPYSKKELLDGTVENDELTEPTEYVLQSSVPESFSKTTYELTETTEYVLQLSVPESFSKTTYDLLKLYIHNYMVAYALEDWMSITNPDKNSKANWYAKIADIRGKIESSINARTGRVRRTLSPF